MVDAQQRQPIRKLELQAADGRVLGAGEVSTKLGVVH
jgi:hypothetical protein